jgi:hypothetical protein
MQEVEATTASPPPPRRVLLISAGGSHSVALICKLNTIKSLTFFFLIWHFGCEKFDFFMEWCPFDVFVVILKIFHVGCEKFKFLIEWCPFDLFVLILKFLPFGL